MIKIPSFIQSLQPYMAGKPIEELQREKNLTQIVKLASNENPLGPSPKAVEAILKATSELHRYTNPSSYFLVNALGKKYGKNPAQFVSASGSDALLAYIVNTFTTEEEEVLTSEGTFIGLYVNVNKMGRKLKLVPLKNYAYDLGLLADNITSSTKIIYLANPNNPTASMFTRSEFESFMKRVPDDVLVILDEAYTIYAEEFEDYPNGLEYDFENLIVLRTLSKAYGLAGIRIGFAYGPEYIIRELYKVKLPFEPNYLAQIAAISALDDDEFIQNTIKCNKLSMNRMIPFFSESGIKFVKSYANFFLLLFPDEEFAVDFNEACLNRGLILRHVKSFGIPNGIRINSGTDEETTFAINVIKEVHTLLLENIGNKV